MTAITDHWPNPYRGPDPLAEASAITRASGTSFGAGMGILPAERRAGMHAIYAFCRHVDDIADGEWSREDKQAALDAWREEVDALFLGRPVSAVGKALLPAVQAYLLPKAEFHALIDGMAMDADGPIVAPPRDQLALYIRRVAGTVGVLSIRVFGAWRSEASDRFALALGDALQLTNILRDVEEDAAIGRVYLPRELLAEYGIADARPEQIAHSPELPAIRRRLGVEARSAYDRARKLAPLHERRALRPALMMMGAYEGYLLKMERLAYQFDPHKPLLSKFQKILRGLQYAYLGPGKAAAA